MRIVFVVVPLRYPIKCNPRLSLMGPDTHEKDVHNFRFSINRGHSYCELLKACSSSSDVSHCGGPHRVASLDLSSIYNYYGVVWWRSFTVVAWCNELFCVVDGLWLIGSYVVATPRGSVESDAEVPVWGSSTSLEPKLLNPSAVSGVCV